jgi:predicted aspartyl protease
LSGPWGSSGALDGDAKAAQDRHVSLFRLNVVARNPKDESRVSVAIDTRVDTGSELTWLPTETLVAIGIEPRRMRTFTTATGDLVQRSVGYAVLEAEGHETIDEVVFGTKGDLSLLGVRTLEGFGVMVDPLAHRLVAVSTVAAGSRE